MRNKERISRKRKRKKSKKYENGELEKCKFYICNFVCL